MDGRRIVCVGLGEKEILVTSCEISEMRRANLQEAKLRSDKSRLANLCESNPLKESICARCLIRSRRELHHAPRRAALLFRYDVSSAFSCANARAFPPSSLNWARARHVRVRA